MIQKKLDASWIASDGRCPRHKTPMRHIYNCGRQVAARIYLFRNCRCSVFHYCDTDGEIDGKPVYTTSFENAAKIIREKAEKVKKYSPKVYS